MKWTNVDVPTTGWKTGDIKPTFAGGEAGWRPGRRHDRRPVFRRHQLRQPGYVAVVQSALAVGGDVHVRRRHLDAGRQGRQRRRRDGDGSTVVELVGWFVLDIRGVDHCSAASLLPPQVTPAEIADPVETELRSFSPKDIAAIVAAVLAS